MNDNKKDTPRDAEAIPDTTPPPAEGSQTGEYEIPEAVRCPTPPRLPSFPGTSILSS